MKNLQALRQFRSVLLCALFFPGSLCGQTDLSSLLLQAHNLKEQGDYFFAANLFKVIASEARDSTMIADAMYGFVTCGDGAAILFTSRMRAIMSIGEANDDSLSRIKLRDILNEDLKTLANAGINLRLTGFEKDYYVNTDTLIRPFLSTHYSNTLTGELATADLMDISCDRVTIISRATDFLRRYPMSQRRFDAMYMLGRAFHDLWEFSNDLDVLTQLDSAEVEGRNRDDLRKEAIRFLSAARESRSDLRKLKWEPRFDEVIAKLEKGQHSGVCFYCCD